MVVRTSLYTALSVAVMTALLLLSYVLLQYLPERGRQALLIQSPELSTTVWAIFDPETGTLRYGSKVDESYGIASITKLLTAYSVLNLKKEETTTTITHADLSTEGTAGKLAYGKTYTLRELLFPLLIESSNDAGVAIARSLGSQYKEEVNRFLTKHNLTHTVVVEPTGLDDRNVSTVRELAQLFVQLKNEYPYITDITQLRMYITQDAGLINNDPLRAFSSFKGGKQGYTPYADHTFVGTFDHNGKEVGIVLLQSSDLVGDVEKILRNIR
jgi:D-alanyl-D-alanine carboxypeptidase